jgi:hypothetical protein
MNKLLICLSFLALACGCTTPKSALDNAGSGNGQLPKKFNPNQGILLIEQSVEEDKSQVALSTHASVSTDTYMNAYMKKNKKAMEEYADKNYQYQHAFTSQDEIYGSGSKYQDKNLYQFALVTSLVKPGQHTNFSSDGRMQSTHNQPIFRFYLYDRLNDKTYSSLGNGSSLVMWAFKNAIKKLNSIK